MLKGMNTPQRALFGVLFYILLSLGCESEPPARQGNGRKQDEPAKTQKKTEQDKPLADASQVQPSSNGVKNGSAEPQRPDPAVQVAKKDQPKEPPKFSDWSRTKLGDNIWLETQGEKKDKRRVLVGAIVCLRQGNYGLECLLCRRGTKEHESILVTTADARVIHGALEVSGAKAGSPVQYEPKFQSPHGQAIKITAAYEQDGKLVTMSPQKWILNQKTRKELEHGWVFAGSKLYKNLEDVDRPPHYAANVDGGYICISNVPSALLDLPINSPKAIDDRIFEPNTKNIPPLDSFVTLILEMP